ncbi:MAG TPA: glycogen synthase GlgA [Casimicrobiaceae bacterium]
MAKRSLSVLFATSECAPLVKTGGLGDVSAALPAALRRLGIDARVLLPGYREVLAGMPAGTAHDLPAGGGIATGATRLIETALPHGVPLIVVDHASAYDRPGGPYQSPAGADWPDNPSRFGLLSNVAAMLAGPASPLAWKPDIIHCNDWQTALAPAYLRFASPPVRCATVQTIHNLAYQGSFTPDWVGRLGLPPASFASEGVEFHGRLSFLKAGLYYADAITTVSPTYAREIQSEALGFGMDGLLRWRHDVLAGILNGIDTEEWNPATDALIAQRYDASTLRAKAANKKALQNALGLAQAPDVPVLGAISRFIEQKGLDLLLATAAGAVASPAQLVVLGQGDAELERAFTRLANEHRGRVAVRIGFDNALAHLIEAGADLFVMPSRFEPCGMNQMFSQRYGTPPIVRATGGLIDSVVDCTPATLAAGTATGFAFAAPSADALLAAIRRSIATYRDAQAWSAVQRNGMARDFGWDAAARQYAELYRSLAGARA